LAPISPTNPFRSFPPLSSDPAPPSAVGAPGYTRLYPGRGAPHSRPLVSPEGVDQIQNWERIRMNRSFEPRVEKFKIKKKLSERLDLLLISHKYLIRILCYPTD